MLINQGFSELKRSDSSIYIRYLKFSFLTVHTKIERRKTSELQTKNRGCGNAFIHTDEQNNVHCRRADTAGCQRNQRSEQNRQKLADALAWASDIAGTSRMGDENTAERCSLSQLEDTHRRIKDRLYNLTDDAPRNLHFAVMCGLIGSGLEEIIDFLNEHKDTKLVIIDTLQKVRDSKGSAGKAGMYGNDYDDISSIKRIADEYNIAIILVHHLRKLKDSDDPFNEVSGSTGIIGAADTSFILKRKRTKDTASLLVSGRDVEYQELTLQFNELIWELVE